MKEEICCQKISVKIPHTLTLCRIVFVFILLLVITIRQLLYVFVPFIINILGANLMFCWVFLLVIHILGIDLLLHCLELLQNFN